VTVWCLGKVARVNRYTESMRKHFLHPRNVGELVDAQAVGEAENSACGDRLKWFLRFTSEGRIDAVRFSAQACSAVIATASMVSEALSGLDVASARALDVDELVRSEGGLPPGRAHALEVVKRALASALASV